MSHLSHLIEYLTWHRNASLIHKYSEALESLPLLWTAYEVLESDECRCIKHPDRLVVSL
jgi:hypothetical protein